MSKYIKKKVGKVSITQKSWLSWNMLQPGGASLTSVRYLIIKKAILTTQTKNEKSVTQGPEQREQVNEDKLFVDVTEEAHDGNTFFYYMEQDEGGCESKNEQEKKVNILEYLPVTELSH